MAVLQVTPPDDSGYCSLGVSLDVGRIAMAQAEVVVGEINAVTIISTGVFFTAIQVPLVISQ